MCIPQNGINRGVENSGNLRKKLYIGQRVSYFPFRNRLKRDIQPFRKLLLRVSHLFSSASNKFTNIIHHAPPPINNYIIQHRLSEFNNHALEIQIDILLTVDYMIDLSAQKLSPADFLTRPIQVYFFFQTKIPNPMESIKLGISFRSFYPIIEGINQLGVSGYSLSKEISKVFSNSEIMEITLLKNASASCCLVGVELLLPIVCMKPTPWYVTCTQYYNEMIHNPQQCIVHFLVQFAFPMNTHHRSRAAYRYIRIPLQASSAV